MADGRLGGKLSWVVVARALAAVIQAISFVYLARELDPATFGLFAAAYGLVTIPQTVFDLGVATYVVRERARNKASGYVTSALRINNWLSIALGATLFALIAGASLAVDAIFLQMIPLAIWAACERNADVWLGVVFADGEVRINTTNVVVRRAVALVLFIIFNLTFLSEDPILAFSLGAVAAAVPSSMFARRFVSPRLPSASPLPLGHLLRQARPYWINSVAAQLRNLDVTITAFFGTPVQAGFYGVAARLIGPLRILPTSLASLLLPAAARSDHSSMAKLWRLIALSSGAMVIFFGLIAVGTPFMVTGFLPQYEDAVPAILIALGGLVFASVASLVGAVLQGVGRRVFVAQVATFTTVLCLAGVALGASFAGAVGASIALGLSFAIQALALSIRLLLFVKRQEPNE